MLIPNYRYIRDLIAGLRNTENYEEHRLAIQTAPSLIRRKSNFGTEVSDHVEELATQLVGMGDSYNLENFQELRLQGMIATLIADPLRMGQWYSNTYFNGDYSISQRASILTTLGLGARELAGYANEDAMWTKSSDSLEAGFPTKKLPEVYNRIYAAPIDRLAQSLEQTMVQPRALQAADKLTGPDPLKVRTFSSRMNVEKQRRRAIPNQLAKIVADGFLFPLSGRFRMLLQSR